ncbi:MAG: zinc ribbon domain-containing protein [Oscillospiraceae bacterium]|nr:zinc ribbon domain-containing protein [Oscillospiraceae bacterium]
MVCTNCRAELNDDSRFCPKCGAAKPDAFSAGTVPFFVEPSSEQFSESRQARASDVPFSESKQNNHFDRPPTQAQRTFDDKSVRRFLIGFSIVSVIVISLVVILIATSGTVS